MLRAIDQKPKKAVSPSKAVLADEELVVRCLRKERDAWVELVELCQGRMVARIRAVLRNSRDASDTAEEVTAKVWLTVIADDGRLLRRFDAQSGNRVATYLSGIATKETLKFLRSTRRRRRRETEYGNSAARRAEISASATVEFGEFLNLLTPDEHQICLRDFLNVPNDVDRDSNARKTSRVRSSIRQKFAVFFGV